MAENLKLHSHKCPKDGTVWSHDDTSGGDEAAHSCPQCKTVVWGRHEESERMFKVADLFSVKMAEFFLEYGIDEKNAIAMMHRTIRNITWQMLDERDKELESATKALEGLAKAAKEHGINVSMGLVNVVTGEVKPIMGDLPDPKVVDEALVKARTELGQHMEKVLGIKPGKA